MNRPLLNIMLKETNKNPNDLTKIELIEDFISKNFMEIIFINNELDLHKQISLLALRDNSKIIDLFLKELELEK